MIMSARSANLRNSGACESLLRGDRGRKGINAPFDDGGELVVSPDSLLLAREHARRINEREVVEYGTVDLRALKFREKVIAEGLQTAERFVRAHRQRVAGYHPVVLAVHNGDESVCRRLWADALPGEIALQEAADEARFADGILSKKKHHRLRFEIGRAQWGRLEVRVLAREFEREHLAPVQAFELSKKEVLVEQRRRQRFREVWGVVEPLVKVGRSRRIRRGLRRA